MSLMLSAVIARAPLNLPRSHGCWKLAFGGFRCTMLHIGDRQASTEATPAHLAREHKCMSSFTSCAHEGSRLLMKGPTGCPIGPSEAAVHRRPAGPL